MILVPKRVGSTGEVEIDKVKIRKKSYEIKFDKVET